MAVTRGGRTPILLIAVVFPSISRWTVDESKALMRLGIDELEEFVGLPSFLGTRLTRVTANVRLPEAPATEPLLKICVSHISV